jgi:hypothetical protein
MDTHRMRRKIAIVFPIFMVGLAILACALPQLPGFPGGTQTTESSSATVPAGTGVTPGVPGSVLTQVAATIFAQVTQEPQSAPPSAATLTSGAISTGVGASQASQTAQASRAISGPQSTPKANMTITPSQPPAAIPPNFNLTPPVGGFSDSGFKIKGVNIHRCANHPWAIFQIYNQSGHTLESLSLLFQDLTGDQTLFGPIASNSPFMSSDRQCSSGGLDALASGSTLYLGNSLYSSHLKDHTIRATITLCTQEGLGGTCYQKITEFVVP